MCVQREPEIPGKVNHFSSEQTSSGWTKGTVHCTRDERKGLDPKNRLDTRPTCDGGRVSPLLDLPLSRGSNDGRLRRNFYRRTTKVLSRPLTPEVSDLTRVGNGRTSRYILPGSFSGGLRNNHGVPDTVSPSPIPTDLSTPTPRSGDFEGEDFLPTERSERRHPRSAWRPPPLPLSVLPSMDPRRRGTDTLGPVQRSTDS